MAKYRPLAQHIWKAATRAPVYTGRVRAVIGDFSGTWVDEHVVAPADVFVKVFDSENVPITMPEAREPMGLRKDIHIAEILKQPDVAKRWRKIKGYDPDQKDIDRMFGKFVPMQLAVLPKYGKMLPGVVETMELLRDTYKIKVGTTTGFTKVMTDVLQTEMGMQGYVPDSCVAGDQVANNLGFRPAPFMLYQNLVNLGVWPIQSVVKIGDTVGDAGEGNHAGCWTVSLFEASNYTDIDSMEEWEKMSDQEKKLAISRSRRYLMDHSNAHYVIRSIRELPIVIDDINERLEQGESP